MKLKKIIILLVTGVFLICGIPACDSSADGDTDGVTETGEADGIWLDVEEYKNRLLEKRVPISECREAYAGDAERVRNTEYSNLSFADAGFVEFPECEEVFLLKEEDYIMPPQEAMDYIEARLEEMGKRDLVDPEKEVFVVTSEVEWDENSYPLLSEHMDIRDAGGAFVDKKECYIMADGSQSDGKIAEYLGNGEDAVNEMYSDTYVHEVVASGTLEELGNQSWPLISGEITIQEGADDSILCMEDAAALLSEKLAPGLRMDVGEVSLVYAPYYAEEPDGNPDIMILPAWRFEGENNTKGEKLMAYIDALTGDLYYYVIESDDQNG